MNEAKPSGEDGQTLNRTKRCPDTSSATPCLLNHLQEIETIRHQRLLFTARFKSELGHQKEVMEAQLEKVL
jgi:hypothetical protein